MWNKEPIAKLNARRKSVIREAGEQSKPVRFAIASKGLFFRFLICITACGGFLYSYIDKQNVVTKRRLEIPVLAKEIKDFKEENTRLQYEIELFESPERLMELARHSEYSHLKQPMLKEIVTMSQGLALQISSDENEEKVAASPKVKFAIGAKQ